MSTWKTVATITPSTNDTYKHYYVSSYSIGIQVNLGITDHGTGWWMTSPGDGNTHQATSGSTDSYTYSTDAIVGQFTIYWADPGTGMSFNSAWASTNYGSKATPAATISPSSGFLKYSIDNVITMRSTYVSGIKTQYTVAGGTLHWKLHSASSYSSIAYSGSTCTIPANTFATGQSYDVYADVTMDDGSVATTAVSTFTTVDAAAVVSIVSPKNSVIAGTAEYKWTYSNSYGSDQYAVDLQISTDAGTNWTDVLNHQITTVQRYTQTIATGGSMEWRVRAYNQDNVAGDWATASFINNMPPAKPTITDISTSGRPTVKWSAGDQIAYRVIVVGVYDSGVIYSTNRFHQIEEYLTDGIYTVKVRVFNSLGLESEYAETTFTQTASMTGPEFELTAIEDGVRIDITKSDAFAFYYIYRDGVCIAKTTAAVYIDKYVSGSTLYLVRGITTADAFGDTEHTIDYTPTYTRLITISGAIFDVSLRWDDMIGIQENETPDISAESYLGNVYPTHDSSEARQRSITLTCQDPGIRQYLGQPLYYADFRKNGGWVVLTARSKAELTFGNEASLTFEFTEYDEAISYDN